MDTGDLDSDHFDVIVVGGGHAGCEAALAAARMGARTALVTLKRATIGALSCNPAMGGIGKGQLVREIDALGGEMGRATDRTALHYRMLNTSKGEAVHSLRAQVDKHDYPLAMQAALATCTALTVIEASVQSVEAATGRVGGVLLGDGARLRGRRVILTNGTFLRGLMHTGERKTTGGRLGEEASVGLTDSLVQLGFETSRLKTGTPPRLAAGSIDWDRTTIQHADPLPPGFSYRLPPPRREWIPCHVTRTSEEVHAVIRTNLGRSPMYSGQITGIGPRYCPSIEDKVVRFAERDAHLVHLERESLTGDSIYVNGVSTSLPADVQEEFVRRIPGLERAQFLRHGYAVEYDFFPPHQIAPTFETRLLPGLYLAGQICGTSGYEEAAGQGLLAGINAALSLRGDEPFLLGRDEAYLGVLADDLVRCDPREPYRMFTSRAEFRLRLRFDNADLRLMEKGERLGLIAPEIADRMRERRTRIEDALARLGSLRAGPDPLVQRLRRPGARFDDLYALAPETEHWQLSEDERERVVVEARYAAYIDRQSTLVDKMRRLDALRLPDELDYRSVRGLSREALDKLARLRPGTLGQAQRIAGVTPADVQVLMVTIHARGWAGGASE